VTSSSKTHLPGAQVQQQAQHSAEEAPVLAAQEPHHGVAAPATGLYALVRCRGACNFLGLVIDIGRRFAPAAQ